MFNMDQPDALTYYDRLRRRRAAILRQLIPIIALMMQFSMLTMIIIMEQLAVPAPAPPRQPYHTSALTGAQWVMELMVGHPRRIRTELGVSHRVFRELLNEMVTLGRGASRHVTLEEQLAIFLYMFVTGNMIRHTGERFQRSNETIAK